jgi:L-malate glycosyltransferase
VGAVESHGPRTIFVAHAASMFTDHLPHGDGLATFNFVSRLAARGHRLHVVVEQVSLSEPLPPTVSLYQLPARRAGHGGDQLRTAHRISRLFEQVRECASVDLVHQLNPVDVGLTCMLPRNAPPIVLGPYVPSWPSGDSMPGRRIGVAPRVGHALAELAKGATQYVQQRRAAAVLLSTPAARAKLKAIGSPRPMIRYVGYGVDADVFEPGGDRASGPPTILFLANLQLRKGVLTLLEAFERVGQDLPDSRLIVAGDGPELAEVERRSRLSRHSDRIELVGRLERAEAAEAMRSADVYCLPSFSEPFGISALEAMASGRPVVATNVGGLAHLVRPQGGRTVPPGDAHALATALTELLASDGLRREMGLFNRALVEQRYSWDAVVDELEAVYREVSTAS